LNFEIGALLVYDITDSDSFARVQNWVKELRRMLGNDVVLVIAGNKCDLERNRTVPQDKAER
jgi:Ras-related protein Rab-21